MDHLNRLISKDLVIGLPRLKFEKDKLCDACQKGNLVNGFILCVYDIVFFWLKF